MLFWISALHFSTIDSFILTTGITILARTSNFDNICISIFLSKDESDERLPISERQIVNPNLVGLLTLDMIKIAIFL